MDAARISGTHIVAGCGGGSSTSDPRAALRSKLLNEEPPGTKTLFVDLDGPGSGTIASTDSTTLFSGPTNV
ncbi:MAG TPA: hypothetical protein VMS64_24005, partial [Candidatus Methylomirabilis sp.]|nr:hypothetical protein [Candidatus Methylomirabilis sp.]